MVNLFEYSALMSKPACKLLHIDFKNYGKNLAAEQIDCCQSDTDHFANFVKV